MDNNIAVLRVAYISSLETSKEFQQRAGELFQLTKSNDTAQIWTSGIQIGGMARDLKEAEYPLSNVLKGDSAVLIAINVHGDVNTGYWDDKLPVIGKFKVNPNIFWNGFPNNFLPQTATINPIPGLKYIIDKSPKMNGLPNNGKPIYIVAAQCYGLQFTKELINIAKDAPNNVLFHGLSYGSTYSNIVEGNPLIDAQHLELSMFVKTIHKRELLS